MPKVDLLKNLERLQFHREWNIGIIIFFAARLGYFYEAKDKGNRKYFTAGLGVSMNFQPGMRSV